MPKHRTVRFCFCEGEHTCDFAGTPATEAEVIADIGTPEERGAAKSRVAWREWFDRVGAAATPEIINATAGLVLAERAIGILPFHDAASHFFHCRGCGEGDLCFEGRAYAEQLGLVNTAEG